MLKTIFIGSKNEFDDVLVDWLSKKTNLEGVVWTKSTAWQKSLSGIWSFTKRRLRRYGIKKVIGESLFFFYYHVFLGSSDKRNIQELIVKPYWNKNNFSRWKGDSTFTFDVNAKNVIDFIEQRKPDLIFAMCINNYFGKRLRSIPKYGVFLWHEGITPEYKGLYSPFWAAHNLDFENIGYTVLKMNEEIDAGEVFVQGKAKNVNPLVHQHGYMGHKAIFDSLEDVEQLIHRIEAGTALPIDRSESISGYYTYPGVLDLIRQKMRIKNYSRKNISLYAPNS